MDGINIVETDLPITARGRAIRQIVYRKENGRPFTRDEVYDMADYQIRVNERRDRGMNAAAPFETQIAVRRGENDWRSGRWFTDEPSVFSIFDYYDHVGDGEDEEEEEETTDAIIMYVRQGFGNAGGGSGGSGEADDNRGFGRGRPAPSNDCFHEALVKAYGLKTSMPLWAQKPDTFKAEIGLKRNDKVPMTTPMMRKIEQLLGSCAINVSGDFIYISQSKSERRIHMALTNEHYTLLMPPGREEKESRYQREPKPVLLYRSIPGSKYTEVYSADLGERNLKKEDINELFNKHISSPYVLCPAERDVPLKDAYEEFETNAKALFEATKGRIDMHRAGKYKIAALQLFKMLSRGAPAPYMPDAFETKYLRETMMGGLIWAREYVGEAIGLDVVSMYPSCMMAPSITWPTRKGEFSTVTDKDCEKFFRYGIYHAEVRGDADAALFRKNKRNYYTHYDLTRARELGLEIKMIQDGEANCLLFAKRTPGSILFKPFVDCMFRLKQNKVPGAKKILNTLWGALCQLNMKKIYVDAKRQKFDLDERFSMERLTPVTENRVCVEYMALKKQWLGEYPAIGCFLTSYARATVSRMIEPHIGRIVRIHTDGFILKGKEKPAGFTYGDRLGELKVEHLGNVEIKNVMKLKWVEDIVKQ